MLFKMAEVNIIKLVCGDGDDEDGKVYYSNNGVDTYNSKIAMTCNHKLFKPVKVVKDGEIEIKEAMDEQIEDFDAKIDKALSLQNIKKMNKNKYALYLNEISRNKNYDKINALVKVQLMIEKMENEYAIIHATKITLDESSVNNFEIKLDMLEKTLDTIKKLYANLISDMNSVVTS